MFCNAAEDHVDGDHCHQVLHRHLLHRVAHLDQDVQSQDRQPEKNQQSRNHLSQRQNVSVDDASSSSFESKSFLFQSY